MTELNYFEMGNRIRERREQLLLTREQLAEKLDVSVKFCSDIELGLRGISITTLNKLVFALDMSADEILYGNSDCEKDKLISAVKKCPHGKEKPLYEIIKAYNKSHN